MLASRLAPGEQRALAQALECLGLAHRAAGALLLRSKAAAAGGPAALQQAADACFQHLSGHTLWLLGGLPQQEGGARLLLALQALQQACALAQQLRHSRPGLDCAPLQPLLLQLLAAVYSQPLQPPQQQQAQEQERQAQQPAQAQEQEQAQEEQRAGPPSGPALAAVSFGSGVRLQAAVLWAARQLAALPEGVRAALRTGLLRLVEQGLAAAGLEGLAEAAEELLAAEEGEGEEQ